MTRIRTLAALSLLLTTVGPNIALGQTTVTTNVNFDDLGLVVFSPLTNAYKGFNWFSGDGAFGVGTAANFTGIL